jgi:CBS domain-containing protein
MRVEEIMTRDVACCTPDMPLREVAKLMVDCDCGVIPVIEGGGSQRLTGIVTDRDIVCRLVAEGRDPIQAPARDAMSTPVFCINPQDDIGRAIEMMEQHHVRRLPVCDANDQCIGMVSQADIVRNLDEHYAAELVRSVSEPMRQART